VLQILGGLLVAIPKTRALGLLILGPIIVNILAFHIFLEHGAQIGPGLVFSLLALFLLWVHRAGFAALVRQKV
jgi:putative oxidoreductase